MKYILAWLSKSKRKRCADDHENDNFDTTTASMLNLSSDSKGYDVKNLPFYGSRFGLLITSLIIMNTYILPRNAELALFI